MIRRIAKSLLACAVTVVLACTTAQAKNAAAYKQINLVSDLSNTAQIVDTNLANAWGISFTTDLTFLSNNVVTNPIVITNTIFTTNHNGHVITTITRSNSFVVLTNLVFSTNSLFWVNANLTGKALVYGVTNNAQSNPVVVKQGMEVTIPGDGNPTGLYFDEKGSISNNVFLFASEDGTISGWNTNLDGTAEVITQRMTAVYKGIGVANTFSNGPVILAANFAEGTVDKYGFLLDTNGTPTNFVLLAQYADFRATNLGFAPFSIQIYKGEVFVLFAKQDSHKIDDVPGPGNGIVDILNPGSGQFTRFITGKGAKGNDKVINSPWAFVVTPATWGKDANRILISNFGDGTIGVYNLKGISQGKLPSNLGGDVTIDGLWGLTFGNGFNAGDPNILYFTAGPTNENHGLFGELIQLAPTKKK